MDNQTNKPMTDIFEEMLDDSTTNETINPGPLEPADRINQPIKITVEPANQLYRPTAPINQSRYNDQGSVRLQSSAIERPKQRHPRFGKLFLIIALILLGYLGWRVWPTTSSGTAANGQNFSFWKSLSLLTKFKLGVSQRTILRGEDQDRINFVLLGVGGKNHDGGNLADTIMVASFQPSTKKVALMSIPRDLTVPITGYGWRKINSANSLAEARESGSGGQAMADLIGSILELPIHYYLRVDFAGFVEMIDDLGGIEIEVDNTLNDYRYPIAGREDHPDYYSRFEHLQIEAGWQKMDGELALKYARSRHAAGVEGSDFARSKRQQKILAAVKEKLFDAANLFKPKLIMNIIGDAEEHITTNLQPEELVSAWQLAKDISPNDIINLNLDNSPTGLLQDQIGTDGAYLLMPKGGDFSQIIDRFNGALIQPITDSAPIETIAKDNKIKTDQATTTINPADLPSRANAKLDIRNSTTINGLAARTNTRLQKYGFTMVNTSNTEKKNLAQTTIYDLTYGAKPDDLALLQYQTKATLSAEIPDWLVNETSRLIKQQPAMTQPDFILILGLDYSNNP